MCTNFKDYKKKKDGQTLVIMSWPLEQMLNNGRKIYYLCLSYMYMYHILIIPHLERIDPVVLNRVNVLFLTKNYPLLIVKLSDPC